MNAAATIESTAPLPLVPPWPPQSELSTPAAFDSASPAPPEAWISVEELLVESCRRRGDALAGIEVSIDCDTAGLRALDDGPGRLRRTVDLLLDAALSGAKPAELHLAARPAGSEESPLLIVSLRALSCPPEVESTPEQRAEELELTGRFAERAGGTMLLSQRSRGERRLTAGIEVRWLVPRPGRAPRPAEPPSWVLLAEDNAVVRRIARRMLEHEGFHVSEAPGILALLAHLDPDETQGPPPSWVFVDEAWLRRGEDEGRGLRAAIESSVRAQQVVQLGGALGSSPDGWRRLSKPLGRAELQELFASESVPSSRNDEAAMPYSLSR